MNRLHHLKETLPQNLLDNSTYQNLEIVILDYNSNDGMESWFKHEMHEYICTGKLIYFRTNQPNIFSHSHAKNMAFKLATGEIVCNVNADHFTGKGFAEYVNNNFKINPNIVITPIDFYKTKPGYIVPKDVKGKVCVRKSDFLSVKGFDERMLGYGFEDFDFINRLEMIQIQRVLIENDQYLKFIAHGDEQRGTDKPSMENLKCLLVNYIKPHLSTIILLYDNGKFLMGDIIDNSTKNSESYVYAYLEHKFTFEYSLKDQKLITGKWYFDNNNSILVKVPETEICFQLNKNHTNYIFTTVGSNIESKFHDITNEEQISGVLDFIYLHKNRSLLENNLDTLLMQPNLNKFGEGIVYKNFVNSIPITVN